MKFCSAFDLFVCFQFSIYSNSDICLTLFGFQTSMETSLYLECETGLMWATSSQHIMWHYLWLILLIGDFLRKVNVASFLIDEGMPCWSPTLEAKMDERETYIKKDKLKIVNIVEILRCYFHVKEIKRLFYEKQKYTVDDNHIRRNIGNV